MKLLLLIITLFCAAAAAQEPAYHEALHAIVDPHIPAYQAVKDLSGQLTSMGTDTMDNVMKLWIQGFKKFYPKVLISLESKGSMTAEPAVTEGRAQLGPLTRELMPDELARFKAKHGYEPLLLKVALGSYRTPTKTAALTFYVHQSNPLEKITLEQLGAIYCTGFTRKPMQDIQTWGQLGLTGEWANRPIHLVGVMQPDGVSNNIRIMLCKDGHFKSNIKEEKIDHSDGAISVLTRNLIDVQKDPSAISYAGFHSRQPGTKPLAIAETAAGPYRMGTFEEVTSGHFPLTRYIYILVNQPPGKPLEPNVKEFLKYVLSRDGQAEVQREGIFLPLPEQVVKEERARLN